MVDSDPRPARPGPPDACATESGLALAPAGAGGPARPDPGPRGEVRVGTGTVALAQHWATVTVRHGPSVTDSK